MDEFFLVLRSSDNGFSIERVSRTVLKKRFEDLEENYYGDAKIHSSIPPGYCDEWPEGIWILRDACIVPRVVERITRVEFP